MRDYLAADILQNANGDKLFLTILGTLLMTKKRPQGMSDANIIDDCTWNNYVKFPLLSQVKVTWQVCVSTVIIKIFLIKTASPVA